MSVFSDVLLLINGFDESNTASPPEVLAPSGVTCAVSPPGHPGGLMGARSNMALLNNTPVLCGGFASETTRCYQYNQQDNDWDRFGTDMTVDLNTDGKMTKINEDKFFTTSLFLPAPLV